MNLSQSSAGFKSSNFSETPHRNVSKKKAHTQIRIDVEGYPAAIFGRNLLNLALNRK